MKLHCTMSVFVVLHWTVFMHIQVQHETALYHVCVFSDSHHQSARYVEQLEADLNSANKHIRSLRDELQQNQSSVFKLEADNLGQTVSGRLCLTVCSSVQ